MIHIILMCFKKILIILKSKNIIVYYKKNYK